MAYLRIAPFVCLGILATLFFLPQTHWVVVNDAAFLTGKTPSDLYYGCLNPKQWPSKTEDQQLAKAVALENSGWNPKSGEEQLGRLVAYCKSYPNDPAGWAHLLRMATKMPLHSPTEFDQAKLSEADLAKRQRYESLIALAASNGERLEPKNTYFTVLKICLLESQGKHAEAQRALLDSREKTGYDDHAMQEAEVDTRVATEAFGYRGAAMQVTVYAGILFPHLSSIRQVLPFVVMDAGKPVVALQIAAGRLLHTIAKNTDSGITVIVAKGTFIRVITGSTAGKKHSPEELARRAAALSSASKTQEPENDLRDFQNVDFQRAETVEPGVNDLFEVGLASPVWSSSVLLSIFLCIPAVFVAAGISALKLKRARHLDQVPERPWLWYLYVVAFCLSLNAFVYSLYRGTGGNNIVSSTSQAASEVMRIESGILAWIWFGVMVLLLAFIPRRRAQIGVAIVIPVSLAVVTYLGLAVRSVRIDASLKGMMSAFAQEAEQVRGPW
jgi:hypothetical protein